MVYIIETGESSVQLEDKGSGATAMKIQQEMSTARNAGSVRSLEIYFAELVDRVYANLDKSIA